MRLGPYSADLLLLVAAAIWGSGFVAQRLGAAHVGPMTFNGLRFALGATILAPVFFLRKPAKTACATPLPVFAWGGLLAGGILFAGAGFQQVGIISTTAGKAGFITGLYLILVPIFGLLIGHCAPLYTWLGAILAAIGLYLLSVAGQIEINPGDLYVLACAVVWAVHVLVIGWLSPRTDPLRLAAVQFAVCAALSLIAALLFERVGWTTIHAAGGAILYSGIFSVGIAFTLQVVGQGVAPPAHAAILLSLEAVFAALIGWHWLGETLVPRELVGCGLMLAGMLVSQIRPARVGPVIMTGGTDSLPG